MHTQVVRGVALDWHEWYEHGVRWIEVTDSWVVDAGEMEGETKGAIVQEFLNRESGR